MWKLGYYRAPHGNVGDDLNAYLWPRLLPGRFAEDATTVFIGIGSIFDDRYNGFPKKILFGAGARSAESVPALDSSWDVHFVRGPLTGRAASVRHITDPAILVARLFPAAHGRRTAVIPYFRSNFRTWSLVARIAGYKLILPTLGVEEFVREMRDCDRAFCESMHGAIIADALRIPWIPLSGANAFMEGTTHAFKWSDWCGSMKVAFEPLQVTPFWTHPRLRPMDLINASLVAARLSTYRKATLSADSVFATKLAQLGECVERLSHCAT